jgi:hypothetical protein
MLELMVCLKCSCSLPMKCLVPATRKNRSTKRGRRTSNDPGSLNAFDGMVDSLAGEVRIRAETLPIAAALGRAAKRADHGAEHDIDALVVVLLAHGVAAVVPDLAVPRRRHCPTGGERGVVVGCPGRQHAPKTWPIGKIRERSHSRTPTGESCMHSERKPSRGMLPTFPTHASPCHLQGVSASEPGCNVARTRRQWSG